jgi:hypothetical protein
MQYILDVENPSQFSDPKHRSTHAMHTGFVDLRSLIPFLLHVGLGPNPRLSKRTPIVREIVETLSTEPEMLPFYSQGLTLSVGEVTRLMGKWIVKADATDPAHGVLDGGHTCLAMLSYVYGKPIRHWDDTRGLDSLAIPKFAPVYVPVTIILSGQGATLDVSEKRNRSSQVSAPDRAVNRGDFDYLRSITSPALSGRIAWTSNAQAPVYARDYILLSLYALNRSDAHMRGKKSPFANAPLGKYAPHTTFKDRARAFDALTQLVQDQDLEALAQSLQKLAEPTAKLWDHIQTTLPQNYNRTPSVTSDAGGSRRWGKLGDPKRRSPRAAELHSAFYGNPLSHPVPKGFVAPIVYAVVQASTVVSEERDRVVHTRDFIDVYKTFTACMMGAYCALLDNHKGDPHSFGNSADVYYALADQLSAILRMVERN